MSSQGTGGGGSEGLASPGSEAGANGNGNDNGNNNGLQRSGSSALSPEDQEKLRSARERGNKLFEKELVRREGGFDRRAFK